jgi:hypothetical protein
MKNLTLILLIVFTTNIYSQSSNDFLNEKIGEFNIETINRLRQSGLISELDLNFLSVYTIGLIENDVLIDTLTYGQILDSYYAHKQQMNAEIAKSFNFGNDSIFIRTPSGDKFFAGMGELSLEKMVERELEKLPKNYADNRLNRDFRDVSQIAQTIFDLNLDEMTALLFGITFFILAEKGKNLTDYKIGDFLEIANKIKNSKEFQPFLDILN